ncbi:MAG TPA: Grx4 family monothiol glutaredoxin [Terriglobales bacterium]|nr:Grx4 family monothiol glutaredoxin [Terriglobales bacterium]
MPLDAETKQRIESLINSNNVLLFMKGDRQQPQCGFSARVVQMLDSIVPEYETIDVLSDANLRDGIKEYSSWPTIPQLYIKGEFIGGCDIVTDLFSSGELHEKLGVPVPERVEPTITITDTAAANLRQHLERAPGRFLHLSIDAHMQASLGLGPQQGSEVTAESNGVTVLMDLMTAQKAQGITIDYVESLGGGSFRVDIPNAPAPVNQLTPSDVKKLRDQGVSFEFFDVRTPEERQTASIAGTQMLDEQAAKRIESLPKDTMLVFHCHHGGRSQAAAEHFRSRGFTNVHNLAGGIDAWSQEVDPSVPRY